MFLDTGPNDFFTGECKQIFMRKIKNILPG